MKQKRPNVGAFVLLANVLCVYEVQGSFIMLRCWLAARQVL